MDKPACIFGGNPHWFAGDKCWHPECPSYDVVFAEAHTQQVTVTDEETGAVTQQTFSVRKPLTQVERNRRWRERNREKYNASMRKHRARKRAEESSNG